MADREYLVSYGCSGEFARFRGPECMDFARGDRVVVRRHPGLDLGTVLCRATEGHARFLSRTALGEIVRPAGPADEDQAEQVRRRGQELFEDGRRLAAERKLPLELVDVEMTLDGQQAVLYYLAGHQCDPRALVSELSVRHDLVLQMQNLAVPKEAVEAGCGRPNCGQNGGGGCHSCASGGCGTCSAGAKKEDIGAYLAGLREQMEAHAQRQPLV